MKVKNRIIVETIVEVTDKDETIIKISETKNETEMLDRLVATVIKAFGLTGNEKQ